MTLPHRHTPIRLKAVWGPKRTISALLVAFACLAPNVAAAKTHSDEGAQKNAGAPGSFAKSYKLDDEMTRRSTDRNGANTTRVIVTLVPGVKLPAEFKRFMRYGRRKINDNNNNDDDDGRLDLIHGQVLDLPNGILKRLAAHPSVFRVHHDRDVATHNYRTSITTGARAARQLLGYTGAGIGIAVIDSGITFWHDDLTSTTSTLFPYGNQRVTKFVDFVNGQTLPYDDNGHGSWTLRQRSVGSYACFAVTIDATDTAIGIFQLRQLEPDFGTAEWAFRARIGVLGNRRVPGRS